MSFSASDLAIRRNPSGWKPETISAIVDVTSSETSSVKNSIGTHRSTSSAGASSLSARHRASRFSTASAGNEPFQPA